MTALNRVRWTHREPLDQGGVLERILSGVYYGDVRHTVSSTGKQMALVRFDGYVRPKRVPYEELTFTGPLS